MATILVKGLLKERIKTVIIKKIDPNFNVVTNTENIFSIQLIIVDVSTLNDLEKKGISNLKDLVDDVYIIAVIDCNDLSSLQELIVEGVVNDYVTKPFTNNELISRTTKAIVEINKKTNNVAIKESLYRRGVMLETITDHLLDVIVQVDQKGNFIYTSNSASKVFGFNLDNLNIKQVVHPEDRFKVTEALKSLQVEAKSVKIELRFKTVNENFLWVEAVGNPLCDHKNGICYGFIFAFRNVSERKKRDVEISTYTRELEEKQLELAAAYQEIKENIEKAHVVQKQFFPANFLLLKVFQCALFMNRPNI